CREIGSLYPVNYNCPQQLVVAGSMDALAQLAKAATILGGRALPLKVSGAFHSPMMDEAALSLAQTLADYHLSPTRLPVFANMTAQPYGDNPQDMIAVQVNHPVLWQQTIENMIKNGARDFIEIGTGSTLCGLIGKIDNSVSTMNIHNKESFDRAVSRYAKEPLC
ncbi:MAG: ACP S-malonyltransferase, partial [Clostridiales bacterium]|nr:ACP S-malonyltransferase [Clostridiales bacterium]